MEVYQKYEIPVDRFAVVGDLHLHHSTPQSRIDDYPTTCCEKLSILRYSLIENNVHTLILLGDIFHVPGERVSFISRVIKEFLLMKANGITIYSINGNHDLSNDRLDSIDNSSLGLLYLLDIIKPFSLIETPHFTITGVPFPDEVPVRISEKYSICVSHRFYNMSESNSLNKDSVKELGYNMYCLGHDHAVYDLTDVDGIKIVRPGSFMRGTSHYYNTSRLVYTDIIDYPVSVTRVTLPVKEPDQVFSATVLEKKSLQTVTQDFSELISKLYDNNVQDEDIYQILEQNVININIKKQIIQYLEQSGIYKEEKDGRTES